jgi:hypothetical protein
LTFEIPYFESSFNLLKAIKQDNFIKILYMLDNTGLTAKQLATDRNTKNHQKVVNLLDQCEARFNKDRKRVEKHEEKAKKEMIKNVKRFQEMREKSKKQQDKADIVAATQQNSRKTITESKTTTRQT